MPADRPGRRLRSIPGDEECVVSVPMKD